MPARMNYLITVKCVFDFQGPIGLYGPKGEPVSCQDAYLFSLCFIVNIDIYTRCDSLSQYDAYDTHIMSVITPGYETWKILNLLLWHCLIIVSVSRQSHIECSSHDALNIGDMPALRPTSPSFHCARWLFNPVLFMTSGTLQMCIFHSIVLSAGKINEYYRY